MKRLVEKGYAVAFDSNCLVVRDIPYLDAQGELQTAAFVTKLVFVDQEQVTQEDHQVFFTGAVPFGLDGNPIPNLAGGPVQFPLTSACNDTIVQRSFSNKPRLTGKYEDFFEKIEGYVAIVSGPAIERYGANPLTFRTIETVDDKSVFKFRDTLTSRAGIGELSAKFHDDVVALIGLGGTGAYLLDFLVKSPVKEIRGFDIDAFHVHNAFRCPGRLNEEELGKSKAEVYRDRYDNFRDGLNIEQKYIDASSSEDLEGVTFAFVCVDKGSSRSEIFDILIAKGIPFIDVGMGLSQKRGALSGMVRATYYPAEKASAVREKALAEEADSPNDLYRTNIQIGELNALNACFAIIKYKQLRGFYLEDDPTFHILFEIGDFSIGGLKDHEI
jgi:hypothetical protein